VACECAWHSRCAGVEASPGLEVHWGVDLKLHPRACIAAIMDVVIDQERMAPERDAAACRLEVCFCSYSVLLVAQPVADVSNQLRQRDAQVGFRRDAPGWQKLAQPIEHHGPERAVVLRQVVDCRRSGQIRRTTGRKRLTVEERWTFDLEVELDFS